MLFNEVKCIIADVVRFFRFLLSEIYLIFMGVSSASINSTVCRSVSHPSGVD